MTCEPAGGRPPSREAGQGVRRRGEIHGVAHALAAGQCFAVDATTGSLVASFSTDCQQPQHLAWAWAALPPVFVVRQPGAVPGGPGRSYAQTLTRAGSILRAFDTPGTHDVLSPDGVSLARLEGTTLFLHSLGFAHATRAVYDVGPATRAAVLAGGSYFVAIERNAAGDEEEVECGVEPEGCTLRLVSNAGAETPLTATGRGVAVASSGDGYVYADDTGVYRRVGAAAATPITGVTAPTRGLGHWGVLAVTGPAGSAAIFADDGRVLFTRPDEMAISVTREGYVRFDATGCDPAVEPCEAVVVDALTGAVDAVPGASGRAVLADGRTVAIDGARLALAGAADPDYVLARLGGLTLAPDPMQIHDAPCVPYARDELGLNAAIAGRGLYCGR